MSHGFWHRLISGEVLGLSSDCTCHGCCYGDFKIFQMAELLLVWFCSYSLVFGVVVPCHSGAHELDASEWWNPLRPSLCWYGVTLCSVAPPAERWVWRLSLQSRYTFLFASSSLLFFLSNPGFGEFCHLSHIYFLLRVFPYTHWDVGFRYFILCYLTYSF